MLVTIRQKFQFWTGLFILSLIVLAAIFSPAIAKFDPNDQNDPITNGYQEPNSKHWFGTDKFGRDIFSRVLFGSRVSLLITISVVLLSTIFGSIYGAASGYFGGIIDQGLMRLVDLFLSFPIVFLAVTCLALFSSGIFTLIIILSLTSWMDIARLVRAEVHSLKQHLFILKAKAVGLSTGRIILFHLLPNVFAIIIVFSIIRMADIILLESALSYIGLGTQPPTPSWGSIISDGKEVLGSAWWITFFPGLAILLTTISLNFIGNGIKSRQE